MVMMMEREKVQMTGQVVIIIGNTDDGHIISVGRKVREKERETLSGEKKEVRMNKSCSLSLNMIGVRVKSRTKSITFLLLSVYLSFLIVLFSNLMGDDLGIFSSFLLVVPLPSSLSFSSFWIALSQSLCIIRASAPLLDLPFCQVTTTMQHPSNSVSILL